MSDQTNMKTFHSYALFHDVGDRDLRVRNCAVVMANILEDNLQDEGTEKNMSQVKLSDKGSRILLGYFAQLSSEDRADVLALFQEVLESRGYQPTFA